MKKTLSPVTLTEESEENQELFEILRVLRKELADHEHVPPFVIFSDSTLKDMCRYYPIDEAFNATNKRGWANEIHEIWAVIYGQDFSICSRK